MHGRIVFLNAAVVAAPEKFTLATEKRRTDGNASFGKTKPSLGDGDFEKCEIVLSRHFVLARLYLKKAAEPTHSRDAEEVATTRIKFLMLAEFWRPPPGF
jgi:hypothetical protein